jgi:transketolase
VRPSRPTGELASAQTENIDELCVDTIRALAMDAVERAHSGHPGAPMGMAPMAYVLWTRFLRHNPNDPRWPDRDRFVLSAGHASMLLYALLHLTGYDLPLEQIERFRQWGSATPGHPERGATPGVETTTGPLGQGFANAVGMAMAERLLADRFNGSGHAIVDHHTYAICSDGDMMEGVASEAASLAGHLGLSKLVCLYDDNRISIDGPTELSFSEDVGRRFEAYGWHVQHVPDGNDLHALELALREAHAEPQRPSFVVVRTHIAFGAPTKQDSADAHGAPLGAAEISAWRERRGWPDRDFAVPDAALARFRTAVGRGAELEHDWQGRVDRWARSDPDLAADWSRVLSGELPRDWEEALPHFGQASVSTRKASGQVLAALAPRIPELVGGSADLTGSNNTALPGEAAFSRESPGRYLHFGVREHAMGAILNGLSVHGGLRPFGGTFLVFSDYMRPSIRLAALMERPVIFVFTHDSIALGEDGPTHEPIEHLAALRAIPGLTVIRPADGAETAQAWSVALRRTDGPTALVLTRQDLPPLEREDPASASLLARGAYVIAGSERSPAAITLIASGSEVHAAWEAAALLRAERGVQARVVSMPSWELFERQDAAYRDGVLAPEVPLRLAVEAGSPQGWTRWIGGAGDVIGIDRFGASAPGAELLERFGFGARSIAERALELIAREERGGR